MSFSKSFIFNSASVVMNSVIRVVCSRHRELAMPAVSNVELISQEVGRWAPSDIAFIQRVEFYNSEASSFDLNLHVLIQPRPPKSAGWPDPNASFWNAEIVFRGVRDLVFTRCGPWDIQTPGFEIEDIRNRQWDGQAILVYDYEGLSEEGIRFGARAAEVLSCKLADSPPNVPRLWREYPGKFPGT